MTAGKPPRRTRERERDLTKEETQLWSKVTDSVAPLEQGRRQETPSAKDETRADHTKSSQQAGAGQSASHDLKSKEFDREPVRDAPSNHASFDRRAARQLASGRREIEAVLDLHGLRQREAHRALMSFLASAQHRGYRYVKVITGKGRPRELDGSLEDDGERGVLKRVVPAWLGEPALRALVVSYTSAGRGHGGEGALYVQVRRARQKSGKSSKG